MNRFQISISAHRIVKIKPGVVFNIIEIITMKTCQHFCATDTLKRKGCCCYKSVIAGILFNWTRLSKVTSSNKMIEIKAPPGLVTQRLDNLYTCMKEKKFTDVTIVVKNKRIFAHMVVLAGCSKFFAENKDNLSATFSNFEIPVIEAILEYCYTGITRIEDKYLEKFKDLAKKLQISLITVDQMKYLEYCHLLDVLESIDIIVENFKTVHTQSCFLNFPAESLAEVLKSEKLNVSTEDILTALKTWVDSDAKNRRNQLADLLSLVKLPSISNELIITKLLDFCNTYPESNDFFKRVILSIASGCQSPIYKEENTNGDKIAIIGDSNSSTANIIEVYDGKHNSWTISKDFKFLKSDFASVLANDWILIIGGYAISEKVCYIDLKTGQKHTLRSLYQGRYNFQAVAIHGESSTDVYAIGGYGNDILRSVERWNSGSKNWERVAPMLKAAYFHSASVINNTIYVAGGRSRQNGNETSTNELQVYWPETNSWSYRAPMIQRRERHSSVVIKGKMYVGGGFIWDTKTLLDGVESYDPNTNMWTSYCTLPNPAEGISLCYFRKKLLCIGGNNQSSFNNQTNVWEYDEISEKWNALKSLNKSRVRSNAIVIPNDSII
ncbi:kelch-like protein 7 [Arctopsyche grandis]|uniref:kelch-like protein 7 n=1 Tax=Arctopsyche grandis TaxID=121162 RepID=UPI00406D96C6